MTEMEALRASGEERLASERQRLGARLEGLMAEVWNQTHKGGWIL